MKETITRKFMAAFSKTSKFELYSEALGRAKIWTDKDNDIYILEIIKIVRATSDGPEDGIEVIEVRK